MPKFSFLISTRNRAQVIKDALESLINQTEADWEAVIIDNGTDNCEEIIKEFNDKRFRYFRPAAIHGSGASCAKNFGALFCRSEIVGIMDDDDIAYPNRIAVSLEAFEKDPDLDVFYGNLDLWNETLNIVTDRNLTLGPPTIELMRRFYFIVHSSVAIKRKVLLDNPYNQFFKIAEDYELMSRLLSAGKKFSFTYEKIVKYRINGDNISIGKGKMELVKAYDTLVKMVRGWIPMDEQILTQIEEKEKNGI